MVDILKQLSLSPRGPGAFALSQYTTDRFCLRQTAKLQYHCYHTSEFYFLLCSSFSYTGDKLLVRLAIYATPVPKTLAQPHTGVQSVFYGSSTARMADRSKQLNLSARGPGRRGAAYRKPAIDKWLS